MVSIATYKLEDLLIDLTENHLDIRHPDTRVFTSFNSKHLDSYHHGIINAEDFDTDDSLTGLNPEYIQNYRRFLGFRYIHLGHLDITGGLTNPNADITFCFDLCVITENPHLICEHDALFNLLLYGSKTDAETLFRESYSENDEILVRKLDLNKAEYILTASPGAQKKSQLLLPNVTQHDISEIKEKVLEFRS